jgi:hypothetical protein
MAIGIIYGYFCVKTGQLAYVGRTAGYWSASIVLKRCHYRHLHSRRRSPFDEILRDNPDDFSLRVLESFEAETVRAAQTRAKMLERLRLCADRPRYNVIRG